MSLAEHGTPAPVPPHKPLTDYYGPDAKRRRYVDELFDRSAHHYDTIERLFLNGGLLYRRVALWRAGLRPGMQVLDVAIGTGAVAKGALKLVGPTGKVFGIDPNRMMLGQARKALDLPLTRGVAEQLPFASGTFDFVTMGIALRHVSDLVATFKEYLRVLKPGGTLWILEGHVPTSRFGQRVTKFMWAKVIPGATLLFTRSRDAKLLMDYYWDTVEQCVPPQTILDAMKSAGFETPKYETWAPGMVCEYKGKRPQPAR